MLSVYDLYDMSAIYKIIRAYPTYELNSSVLEKLLLVLKNNDSRYEYNQIRTSLSMISNLDTEKFFFVPTLNVYSYFPGFLKNESVYRVLIEATNKLLDCVKNDQVQISVDLADCLHNLPIDIADNRFSIPPKFWKAEVLTFRKKWDTSFLCNEESLFSKKVRRG